MVTAAAISATHRRVALYGEVPHEAQVERTKNDPEDLHEQTADELFVRQVAQQRLDRKAEGPYERQEIRQLLGPLGHQRQWYQPAGQQQLQRQVQLEDGPHASR